MDNSNVVGDHMSIWVYGRESGKLQFNTRSKKARRYKEHSTGVDWIGPDLISVDQWGSGRGYIIVVSSRYWLHGISRE